MSSSSKCYGEIKSKGDEAFQTLTGWVGWGGVGKAGY